MAMSKMSKHGHRPRVEGEREDEILDATVTLLMEVGYDRLTMDAVAKEAHASKATLYRRWETKASLVVEALVRAKSAPHVADHDTGSLRTDDIIFDVIADHDRLTGWQVYRQQSLLKKGLVWFAQNDRLLAGR